MNNEENEMAKIAYEMQALRARADDLQRQAGAIQQIAEGTQATVEALSKLGKAKDAMFQVGTGVMAKAAPSGTVFVEVGAGVTVEMKPEEAKKILEERARQAAAALQQTQKALNETASRMNALAEMAESLRSKGKGTGGMT